jgi:RNA polymerase sigma-70 factor, ECF subfamily
MNSHPEPESTPEGGRPLPAETGDSARVAALARADRGAIEELYREMFDPVYAFVYWRVNGVRADAEDVTQETFVTALAQIQRFEARSSLYTWLCGIARNLAHARVRTRGRGGDERDPVRAAAPAPAAPDLLLERAQSESLVGAALTELPPHYQRALLDKYVRQRSFVEMAAADGVSAKAVESTVQRAKRALAEALARRGLAQGHMQVQEGGSGV